MHESDPDELTRLRAELAASRQREAALRERTTREFFELQSRIQPLTTVIGERGRTIEDLKQRELALRLELERAHADLEAFTWMLQTMDQAREHAERRRPANWLRSLLGGSPTPVEPRVPAGEFLYHLTTSPFRLYRGAEFTLSGWAFPRDGRAMTAVRVRFAGREFEGRTGLPAPEAIAQHGPSPKNPQPGFEVTFATPPGQHRLALEARLGDGDWRTVLSLPAWVRPQA